MKQFGVTFVLFVTGLVVLIALVEGKEDRLSEQLWNLTSDVRSKTLDTAFIKGLRLRNLDPVKFGKFNIQDGIWCEKVSKAMQEAADKTPDFTARHAKGVLRQKSLDYSRYAYDIYTKFGLKDGRSIEAVGACVSYYEYERMVARTMDYGYMLACMIPCEKLWPWLGEQLLATQKDFGAYTDWVNNSLDPTYKSYEELDVIVDSLYAEGLLDKNLAYRVYRNCMLAELGFFNMIQ